MRVCKPAVQGQHALRRDMARGVPPQQRTHLRTRPRSNLTPWGCSSCPRSSSGCCWCTGSGGRRACISGQKVSWWRACASVQAAGGLPGPPSRNGGLHARVAAAAAAAAAVRSTCGTPVPLETPAALPLLPRHPETTIITWHDAEINSDVAISFQEQSGCEHVW